MKIHEFTDNDYDVIADIRNACFPDSPGTAEEQRRRDKSLDPKCRQARWVIETDGNIVAWGDYFQHSVAYHPRKFAFSIHVHPDHRGRGIGTTLYNHILRALEPFDPLSVGMFLREDHERGVWFLSKRGFHQKLRNRMSTLDIATFDFTRFNGAEEKVRAQGIEILPLPRLQTDPDYERKLYELSCAIERDIPSISEVTDSPFDVWLENQLHSSHILPGGYFVAVDGDRFVGISNVCRVTDDMVTPDQTGVDREYRRRGIALALKIAVNRWCVENYIKTIRTYNEEANTGMLAINDMLGFVAGPASVWFEKTLVEEEAQEKEEP
jgi:mycothiol synthase